MWKEKRVVKFLDAKKIVSVEEELWYWFIQLKVANVNGLNMSIKR